MRALRPTRHHLGALTMRQVVERVVFGEHPASLRHLDGLRKLLLLAQRAALRKLLTIVHAKQALSLLYRVGPLGRVDAGCADIDADSISALTTSLSHRQVVM